MCFFGLYKDSSAISVPNFITCIIIIIYVSFSIKTFFIFVRFNAQIVRNRTKKKEAVLMIETASFY
jgi:hypothetical protein